MNAYVDRTRPALSLVDIGIASATDASYCPPNPGNSSLFTLQVEAGKTYYIQQHVEMGLMKARNTVSLMTEEEGSKKLKGTNLSTWEVK